MENSLLSRETAGFTFTAKHASERSKLPDSRVQSPKRPETSNALRCVTGLFLYPRDRESTARIAKNAYERKDGIYGTYQGTA